MIFLLLGVKGLNAQTTSKNIIFSWDGSQVLPDTPLLNLKFPINFIFNKDFKGKSIVFMDYNDTLKVIALEGRKFGDSKLKSRGDGSFQLVIDKGIIVGQDNAKIKDNFRIKIDSAAPIPVTIITNDILTGEQIEENYKPGYLYYDAIRLAQEKNEIFKFKILKSYGYTSTDSVKFNPYFKDIFTNSNFSTNQGGITSFGSVLTNLGNTDVTNFAAGLARFLAERTKEELNEAFFNKMKEQLNAYPELMTVFPNTSKMLNIIETFSYASVLQVLKEAFETDIQNLPSNLYDIKDLKEDDCDKIKLSKNDSISCHNRLKILSDFFASQDGRWVALGMYSVKEVIQSTNPADLLKSVVASTEFIDLKKTSLDSSNYDDYNIASTIELSNVISQSLISKEDKQVWITTKQLDSLFKQKDAFMIYLGLILALEQQKEKDKKIIFYNKSDEQIGLESLLKESFEKYEELKPLIKNVFTTYNAANNAVKKMVAASEKSVEVEPQALYDYYKTFTASLKPIAHNAILDTLLHREIGASYDKVLNFLNPSVDIAYHISTKKYSAAIYDASILLSALNDFKITSTNKKGEIKKDKKGKIITENYVGFKSFTKSFVKYGTLISTVANAQSSDEVKKAIEASVLPVGSSAIKRNSNWSISVNAYVGGFYGKAYTHVKEYKYDDSNNIIDSNRVKKSYKTYGLYAPIGVSFNKGFKCSWGVSITTQIIDVGALVNFYLKEGDQTAIPSDFKIRLSNIFAPGAQLGLNIAKTPLTLTGGFQYVPSLYKTEQIASSSEIVGSSAVRWHIGLVVDIPMYNIKVWDFKK